MHERIDPGREQTERKPFVVAHRAGNRLDALRAAELSGSELVEADVRLFHGRLEVRHLRTVGPIPILWDRWQVAFPRAPRLELPALISATAPETELMLDLKGYRIRVAEAVRDLVRPYLGTRRFTVCARRWRLLEPFAGLPVRSVHSIGTARELRRFFERFGAERLQGVSVHERLLEPASIASLRSIAEVVMTWPVNGSERARELVQLGVDGLITDDVTTFDAPNGALASA